MALLLLMAVAVAVLRLRGNHGVPSPYGALPSSGPVAAQRVVPPPLTSTVPHAVATQQPTSTIASTDPVASSISGPVSVMPAAVDPNRMQPRVISIDRAAAGSAVPQPAPAAVVQAAARAAAATPQPAAVSATPAAPPPSVPAAVAMMDPKPNAAPASDDGTAAGQPPGPGGLININTATAAELDGVGAGHIGKTIVRHRPYHSVQELMDHRVLKASDFARIRGAITAN